MSRPLIVADASIEPTMTDKDVLEFCQNGFVLLKNIVPAQTNEKVTAFLEEHNGFAPSELLDEQYFVNDVLLNSQLVGYIRSLLGERFALPVMMANHRAVGMKKGTGGWHQDACSIADPPSLPYLQVFYYPQDVTLEMGPTAVIPGTHLVKANGIGHFGNVRSQVFTTAPAGSVFITAYPIWHRATEKTALPTRNLLKWIYWRTVQPARDWVRDPEFDPDTAEYSISTNLSLGHTEPIQWSVAKLFYWLCGRASDYSTSGGQDWPLVTSNTTYPNINHDAAKQLFRLIRSAG